MTIYKLENGNLADADEVMANLNKTLSFNILNKGRQTIDRASVDSVGQDDIFSEAYVDSTGQNNTVNTTRTTTSAIFDTNKYTLTLLDTAGSDTTNNPDSLVSPENFFDGDDSTASSFSTTATGTFTKSLGKTFASRNIYKIFIKASCNNNDGGNQNYIYLQTYDGSVWSTITTLASGTGSASFTGYYTLNNITQGIRIQTSWYSLGGTNKSHTFYTLEYGDEIESIISHTIPTGTYPANVSKLIGKASYVNWESGVNVQHKLTNATEDSGWIDDGIIGSFTAFISEPTKYLVKLIPKTTSPTSGYPSINTAGVYCE